jgi:hypothetical protein
VRRKLISYRPAGDPPDQRTDDGACRATTDSADNRTDDYPQNHMIALSENSNTPRRDLDYFRTSEYRRHAIRFLRQQENILPQSCMNIHLFFHLTRRAYSAPYLPECETRLG